MFSFQWQTRTKSKIFLIYRLALSIFYTVVVIMSIHNHVTYYAPIGYYFIYLTNWGIMMCMLCTALGAALVTTWHFHPELAQKVRPGNDMPHVFAFYWGLHNITLILSLMITILYWGIIYNEETDKLDAVNLLTHGTNSVFMFLDLIIVAHPVRLLHVVQPLAFGLVYGIFTLIYYLAGGVDG